MKFIFCFRWTLFLVSFYLILKDLKNAKKFSDMLNIEKSKPHIKKTSKGEIYVEGDRVNFIGNFICV